MSKDINKPRITTFKSVAKRMAEMKKIKTPKVKGRTKKQQDEFDEEFEAMKLNAYWEGLY